MAFYVKPLNELKKLYSMGLGIYRHYYYIIILNVILCYDLLDITPIIYIKIKNIKHSVYDYNKDNVLDKKV